MRRIAVLGIVTLLAFLYSCQPQGEETHQPTPYELPTPLFFPTVNNIPADNPMTEEGVALGERLFNAELGIRN